jgi:polyhydroxyalkanoate synthesis regulator phasin
MKPNKRTCGTFAAGAMALLLGTVPAATQSVDALLDKLVDKGILTVKEANELKQESDKNFTSALQTKTGLPGTRRANHIGQFGLD